MQTFTCDKTFYSCFYICSDESMRQWSWMNCLSRCESVVRLKPLEIRLYTHIYKYISLLGLTCIGFRKLSGVCSIFQFYYVRILYQKSLNFFCIDENSLHCHSKRWSFELFPLIQFKFNLICNSGISWHSLLNDLSKNASLRCISVNSFSVLTLLVSLLPSLLLIIQLCLFSSQTCNEYTCE